MGHLVCKKDNTWHCPGKVLKWWKLKLYFTITFINVIYFMSVSVQSSKFLSLFFEQLVHKLQALFTFLRSEMFAWEMLISSPFDLSTRCYYVNIQLYEYILRDFIWFYPNTIYPIYTIAVIMIYEKYHLNEYLTKN